MYYSVPTLDAPEFLNLTPYNPLISKCEIKVLYVGENRNGSVIYRDVAEKMANTLPGCPIVGMWIENNKDFGSHENKIIIEDGVIKTLSETRPYGFVSPDARVWFQKFEEFDARTGDLVVRDYLMTEGLLWTGQYEEAKRIIEKGNNQSMELDRDTLKGEWANSDNGEYEFFIINDAVFSKLCILGENVEPCFEGATIGDLDVSKHFALNQDFTKTLYSMVQELKNIKKGESNVAEQNLENVEFEQTLDETPALDNELAETETETEVETEYAAEAEEVVEPESEVVEEPTFTLEDYEALQAENARLNETVEALTHEVEDLRAFKLVADRKEKQAMIDSFTMLEDTDKLDVQENIDNYSLDDIEAKLSIICVRNKVNFNSNDDAENDNSVGNQLSYSLNDAPGEPEVPAWLQAVKEHSNR